MLTVCAFMISLLHGESRATIGSGEATRSESGAPFTAVPHNADERANPIRVCGAAERPDTAPWFWRGCSLWFFIYPACWPGGEWVFPVVSVGSRLPMVGRHRQPAR